MKKKTVFTRLLAVGTAAMLALSLAACGGSQQSQGTEEKKEETEAAEAAEEAPEEEQAEEAVSEAVAEVSVGDTTAKKGDSVGADGPKYYGGENGEIEFSVFSSEKMGFSFLYESRHKAELTESGAAVLRIGGNDQLKGLFVSVVDAKDMPEVSQILEEEKFNVTQEHAGKLVEGPEDMPLDAEGHSMTGFLYVYKDASDQYVLCTYFVEVRDGKYVFLASEGYYLGEGKELEALGEALVSVEFDPKYYY